MSNAGLIAASCRQLDTLIQESVSQGNLHTKLGTGIMDKVYPNGNASKPANMISEVFSYCNGVHV